jgi:hypothetical protein
VLVSQAQRTQHETPKEEMQLQTLILKLLRLLEHLVVNLVVSAHLAAVVVAIILLSVVRLA